MDFITENIFFVLVLTIGMYVLFKLPKQIHFFFTKEDIGNEQLKKTYLENRYQKEYPNQKIGVDRPRKKNDPWKVYIGDETFRNIDFIQGSDDKIKQESTWKFNKEDQKDEFIKLRKWDKDGNEVVSNPKKKENKKNLKPKEDKNTTSDSKKVKDLLINKKEEIKNDNGFNRVYSESGYQEFFLKDGRPHGECKVFNRKGILIYHIEDSKLNSSNGFILHGKEKNYYENGKIKSEVSFIKGKRNGFGLSYTEDGWIEQIDYYKNDVDVTQDSDENKNLMLKEIKKYMNNGINVYPIQYMFLCRSIGIDPKKFLKDNLKK